MINGSGKIRLYVAEEQQIFREAYRSFFLSSSAMEVVGASGDTDGESLSMAA
ncbi:MAG: hypothetical protein HW388_1189, partial [Dehalococcoidia bacterium]|nr:hypothetical protein [Dehalococcoidia bacterium]